MKSRNFFQDVQQKIAQAFEDQDPELSDVIFEIDGQKLYAHKFFLSIISDTFKAMLSERWNSKNEPIELKGYKLEDFKEFLTFLYTSECNITDENIFTILDLAEFYHIEHLKDLCDEYLSKMKLTDTNIFQMIEMSNKYSMKRLKKFTDSFVANNFSSLIKSDHFLKVDSAVIEEFVAVNSKNVKPEEVFQAVYEWVERQVIKKQEESNEEHINLKDAIKAAITPFLPNIQFKKMKLNFLNRYVVKRGFLFTYDELADMLENANPDIKVTVTNSNGDTMYGFLTSKTYPLTINVIKSLKNCDSDNKDNIMIYWKTTRKAPSISYQLQRSTAINWYLIYLSDGSIGIKHCFYIDGSDHLLAEMNSDVDFLFTTNCKIEIE